GADRTDAVGADGDRDGGGGAVERLAALSHRGSGPVRRAALLTATLVALAGCASKGGDPNRQIGANPQLPEPQNYLLPPMHVAGADPWKSGQGPTVPAGLKVQPFAQGLLNPRVVYPLPNGDVLVVETGGPSEPIHRPKD